MHTTLALTAGALYALGALFVKQAESRGLGTKRNLFLSNILMAIVVSVFCTLQPLSFNWSHTYQPIIAGLTFFIGQVTTFLSIRLGDVSVTTPIMGTKAIFIAFIAPVLFGTYIAPTIWMAAVLSFLGVACLSFKKGVVSKSPLAAIATALVSASFFGLTDTLVAEWAHDYGRYGFLLIMFASMAVSSFFLVPFFGEPLSKLARPALQFGLLGSLFLAIQALLVVLALSIYQMPATTNILYSSRGLWSLLLILALGPLIGSQEYKQGRTTLLFRFAGAGLMTIAIIFVLV